jgi:hypothetical protein
MAIAYLSQRAIEEQQTLDRMDRLAALYLYLSKVERNRS